MAPNHRPRPVNFSFRFVFYSSLRARALSSLCRMTSLSYAVQRVSESSVTSSSAIDPRPAPLPFITLPYPLTDRPMSNKQSPVLRRLGLISISPLPSLLLFFVAYAVPFIFPTFRFLPPFLLRLKLESRRRSSPVISIPRAFFSRYCYHLSVHLRLRLCALLR